MKIWAVGNTEIEFLPDEPALKLFGTYQGANNYANTNQYLSEVEAELDTSKIEAAIAYIIKEYNYDCHEQGILLGLKLALKLINKEYDDAGDCDVFMGELRKAGVLK